MDAQSVVKKFGGTKPLLRYGGAVNPIEVPESSVVRTIPVLIFFSLGLLYLIKSDWRVTRRQGFLALGCYAAFIAAAFAMNWQ